MKPLVADYAAYQTGRKYGRSNLKFALVLLLLSTRENGGVVASSRRSWAWNRIRNHSFNRPAFLRTKSFDSLKQHFGNPSACFVEAMRIRCGASEVKPSAIKMRQKGKKPKNQDTGKANLAKTFKQSSTPPGIFQLTLVSESSLSSSSTPCLHVKALLTDRVVSWKVIFRGFLGCLITGYLRQCIQRAGIPRREAIWTLLHNAGLVEPTDSRPPTSFQPTPLEVFLAETLARASNDLIPPSAMPSGPSFVGALLSCLAWILATVLLPHWVLPLRLWYDYHLLSTPLQDDYNVKDRTPTAVLVEVARPAGRQSSRSRVVCRLQSTSLRSQMGHGMPPFYFEHNHRRYYYDPKSNQCWEGGPNLSAWTVGELTAKATKESSMSDKDASPEYRGLLHAPSQLVHAQDRWYTYNHQTAVPIPNIRQALLVRLKSPLVVIQLIGKAVAALEDGKAAFLAFAQTVFQHYHNANSMIKSSKALQKDVAGLAAEFATQPVWIYRAGGWKVMEASNLLPGDLFLLTTTSAADATVANSSGEKASSDHNPVVVPVDALVLEGLCVTMEAVLTGESVPQTKMPIDNTMPEWNQPIDMLGSHRSAIVFAGTTILHCMPSTETKLYAQEQKNTLPNGVLCLALRTGSYSSKGELINALTASGAKSGVATISNAQFDQDSLKLISIMSFLSTIACASLFWKPSGLHKKVSGFRRLIQCTRIATACVPSDLPLSLSYVVQSCADVLRQEADVVCSQPGALLTSAEIDTVVFDKTGTLTADTQSLSKVISYSGLSTSKISRPKEMAAYHTDTNDTKQSTPFQLVLAGCHSLVCLENDRPQQSPHGSDCSQPSASLVGDPIELAALKWLGWSFKPDGGYFHPPIDAIDNSGRSTGVEKLWQLQVFPFSPRVRLSSALCLTRHFNGEYKIWAVVKGAPEALRPLLSQGEEDQEPRFERWYERRVKKLESKGFRILAMASREVQPTDVTFSGTESEVLKFARRYAATVHRSDLEASNRLASFCGLACFDAKIRPSSRRIIQELRTGNMHSIMLTGDSMEAAVAVARKVGILQEKSEIVVLETANPSKNESDQGELQWRLPPFAERKEKVIRCTTKTVGAILKKARRGELAMVSSGKALMALTGNQKSLQWCQPLVDDLGCFSVVARASPECKESFVGLLSNKRKVLMCGDGVNDVSAMKEAEVSVALLNGFGAESDLSSGDGKDIEDERRKQRLLNKKTHARRINTTSSDFLDGLHEQGIGSSSAASRARIQQKIEAAQETITKRALKRHKMNATSSEPVPYSLSDLKDMLSTVMSAARDERRRAKKLKQGGGEAATILLEEDIQMRTGPNSTSTSIVEVRPGEACMASPFSCLRSSIDGVEAVLRAGVATAACTLSIQQKMALNLLLTCFNLSALYRDGFRYGKNMATVEFVLYMIVDQASYRESCRMRPRLPASKRQIANSLFDSTSLISVVLQTVSHLVLMQAGIMFARNLETQSPAGKSVNSKPLIRVAKSQAPKVAALLGALVEGDLKAHASKEDKKENILGQPKFVPNFETNVVFALSVIQGTLTTLLMHKGAPFYVSILESPLLCFWSGLCVIFALACILETFPLVNSVLELRPWTAPRHKLFVLSLAIIDTLACSIIEFFCRKRAKEGTVVANRNSGFRRTTQTAADLEEQMLLEESRKNAMLVLVFAGVVGTMVLDAVLRASLQVHRVVR